MMRSLYSGVAGLKSHQTKMDVIGNNIANVNTIGFKSSSVLFRDVLYQTTSNATGATNNTGGTNASQIGLGTKVSSITTSVDSTGAAQSTNNPYDLMINGSSFFIVSRGGKNYFTKVGSFGVDGAGCLTTSSGYQVMGWQVDPSNPNVIKKDTVSALYPESEANKVSSPEQTSKAYMTGNIDLTDVDLTSTDGGNVSLSIYDALGYSYTVKFSLKQDADVEDKSVYTLKIVSVKDSNNVELLHDDDPETVAEEGGYSATIGGLDSVKVRFNPENGSFERVETADNGLLANDIVAGQLADAIAASNLSNANSTLTVALEPSTLGNAVITYNAATGAADIKVDSEAARKSLESDMTKVQQALTAKGLRANTITVTPSDDYKAVDPQLRLEALIRISPVDDNGDPTGKADVFTSTVNGERVDGITVDFTNLTMYESDGNSTAKLVRGATDSTCGGRAMGKLDDVSIDNTGKIYGVYSNGETKLLGQIAVATFVNPMAMESLGDSLYASTQNSGEFDGIGSAINEAGETMSQGVLEMSNVDLSAEFTDMITTQRGFQANSRIITTSDSMLEELVNLKR